MKKELFYYWESFCLTNALLCLVASTFALLSPDYPASWDTGTILYIFALPFIMSDKMKLKLRYRVTISLLLLLVINPLLEALAPIRLHPSTLQTFLLSLFFGMLALGNDLYQKRKTKTQ